MLINNTDWVAVSEFISSLQSANNVCRTQKHIP